VGYALERPIERRLGTPLSIAASLAAGSAGMAWADRMPEQRVASEAAARDALYLGLGQAVALVPGVSRGGATRIAARLRSFTRPESSRLSRQIGLPVLGGAALLKGIRLARGGLPARARGPFALGAGAAFVSTLACARPIRRLDREGRLAPYALYRLALAALVLIRRSGQRP
jgi:undecaprenyl-diphosphatase